MWLIPQKFHSQNPIPKHTKNPITHTQIPALHFVYINYIVCHYIFHVIVCNHCHLIDVNNPLIFM